MKICYKCKVAKDNSKFVKDKHQKDGLSRRCMDCDKIYNATKIEYRKEYRKSNSEILKAKAKEYNKREDVKERNRKRPVDREYLKIYFKEYRAKNKEKCIGYRKKYEEANKDKQFLYRREYRKSNNVLLKKYMKIYGEVNKKSLREKANERRRKRMKTDIAFKLLHNLRRRFGLIVEGKRKCDTTKNLIGCDLHNLKIHLESKFTNEMCWDNYGSYWEIDHIIPCKLFNLLEAKEQKRCFHYTNLQPLSCVDNRSKGAKIIQYEY